MSSMLRNRELFIRETEKALVNKKCNTKCWDDECPWFSFQGHRAQVKNELYDTSCISNCEDHYQRIIVKIYVGCQFLSATLLTLSSMCPFIVLNVIDLCHAERCWLLLCIKIAKAAAKGPAKLHQWAPLSQHHMLSQQARQEHEGICSTKETFHKKLW